MTIKLTEAQERALRHLETTGGSVHANDIGLALGRTIQPALSMSPDLHRLWQNGLVRNEGDRIYTITPAGRAWLAAKDKGEQV